MGNKQNTSRKFSDGSFKPIRCKTKIGRGAEDDEQIIRDLWKYHYNTLKSQYDGCSEVDRELFVKELNELFAELGDEFKEGQDEFETKLSDCNPTDNKNIIEGLERMKILEIIEAAN